MKWYMPSGASDLAVGALESHVASIVQNGTLLFNLPIKVHSVDKNTSSGDVTRIRLAVEGTALGDQVRSVHFGRIEIDFANRWAEMYDGTFQMSFTQTGFASRYSNYVTHAGAAFADSLNATRVYAHVPVPVWPAFYMWNQNLTHFTWRTSYFP